MNGHLRALAAIALIASMEFLAPVPTFACGDPIPNYTVAQKPSIVRVDPRSAAALRPVRQWRAAMRRARLARTWTPSRIARANPCGTGRAVANSAQWWDSGVAVCRYPAS